MRILSLHVRFLPAVVAGTKTTTIRKEIHPDRFYQLWSPGPRTGKGIRRGVVEIRAIYNVKGSDLNNHHAIHDGFRNVQELRSALAKLNSMLISEVMEHRWHILEFRYIPDAHAGVEGDGKTDSLQELSQGVSSNEKGSGTETKDRIGVSPRQPPSASDARGRGLGDPSVKDRPAGVEPSEGCHPHVGPQFSKPAIPLAASIDILELGWQPPQGTSMARGREDPSRLAKRGRYGSHTPFGSARSRVLNDIPPRGRPSPEKGRGPSSPGGGLRGGDSPCSWQRTWDWEAPRSPSPSRDGKLSRGVSCLAGEPGPKSSPHSSGPDRPGRTDALRSERAARRLWRNRSRLTPGQDAVDLGPTVRASHPPPDGSSGVVEVRRPPRDYRRDARPSEHGNDPKVSRDPHRGPAGSARGAIRTTGPGPKPGYGQGTEKPRNPNHPVGVAGLKGYGPESSHWLPEINPDEVERRNWAEGARDYARLLTVDPEAGDLEDHLVYEPLLALPGPISPGPVLEDGPSSDWLGVRHTGYGNSGERTVR